jgi:hypothetical protein
LLTHHIALVDQSGTLHVGDLQRAAAALQKQVTRDFLPIWKVHATVNAFHSLDIVPEDYWPILIGSEGQGGGGVHLDENNQPYALVDLTDTWTLTASHECLEMLVDPWGNRLVAGDSIVSDQGRVKYLVEVCDPCETPECSYTVNRVQVSDFYTPRFFDPVTVSGVRYSFSGHIKHPHQVLPGGYLTWQVPATKEWWQRRWFGTAAEDVNLGVLEGMGSSIRSHIDGIVRDLRKNGG